MASTNGTSVDLSPAARKGLPGGAIGSSFDPHDRLFAAFDGGAVFDYTQQFEAADLKEMLAREGKARSLEQVLTLPLRAADWKLTKPATGEKGQTALCQDVLGDKLNRLLDQMTAAVTFRKSFHEKTWRLDGSKVVYDDLLWRPPASCDAGFDPSTGVSQGFRQRVFPIDGKLPPGAGNSNRLPGYVYIPSRRSFIYTHGTHRDPIRGISDLDVAYWALAYDSKVQTPDGPVAIQDIQTGDYVFGRNGSPTKVTAVHERGQRQMYRVTMKDGSSVECDAEHLWSVADKNRMLKHDLHVMSTQQILDAGLRYTCSSPAWRFAVPRCAAVEYPERDLPIDPYILGAWLGDGTIRKAADGERRSGPYIYSFEPDEWIANEISRRLLPDMRLHLAAKGNKGMYRFSPVVARDTNHVRDALVALGVNKYSVERFIPELYLQSSVKQRLAMLQGLMDTDGSAGATRPLNSARYYTKSTRLAADVQQLVRSLGGTAILRSASGEKEGPVRWDKRDWDSPGRYIRVEIQLGYNPFMLPRKAERWKCGDRYAENAIVSIEPTKESECRCITVEAADGLFVTDDYVVTHNCYKTQQKVLFLWFQFLENQSLPKVAVYGDSLPQAQETAQGFAQLKSSGILPMARPNDPAAKAFELIESGGHGAQQFQAALTYLDGKMSASVLAGFTDLPQAAVAGMGSYALSADQSEFFLASRQAVADEMADAVRRDIIGPLVAYNYGPDAALPRFEIGPLSSRYTERALTMLQDIVRSRYSNVPRDFVDQLVVSSASFLGLDPEKVQHAVDVDRAEAEAQAAAAQAAPGAASTGGKQAGLYPPPTDTLGKWQNTQAFPPGSGPALSRAVDVVTDLVASVQGGQDPQDALLDLARR